MAVELGPSQLPIHRDRWEGDWMLPIVFEEFPMPR